MMALIFMVPTYVGRVRSRAAPMLVGSGAARRQRCLPCRVCLSGVSPEGLCQPCHLAFQPAPGTTHVGSCQVDPGLDLGHLGAPALCLLGTGRAPWLDHPSPLEQQPGSFDAPLGSSSELVALGQVCGVTLQSCSCFVQIIGGGSQCPQ